MKKIVITSLLLIHAWGYSQGVPYYPSFKAKEREPMTPYDPRPGLEQQRQDNLERQRQEHESDMLLLQYQIERKRKEDQQKEQEKQQEEESKQFLSSYYPVFRQIVESFKTEGDSLYTNIEIDDYGQKCIMIHSKYTDVNKEQERETSELLASLCYYHILNTINIENTSQIDKATFEGLMQYYGINTIRIKTKNSVQFCIFPEIYSREKLKEMLGY